MARVAIGGVMIQTYKYIAQEGQRALQYENERIYRMEGFMQGWAAAINKDIAEYVKKEFPYGNENDRWQDFKLVTARSAKLVFDWKFKFHNGREYILKDYRGIVLPMLNYPYSLKILGSNREEVKEYMATEIDKWLMSELPETVDDSYLHPNEKTFMEK